MGIVGTGWWGSSILASFGISSGEVDIIAICDVSEDNLHAASNLVTQATGATPKLFNDYREMYDLEGLQAVAIATPTHWHALQFIAACEKGLDIWLEKPISYDIREAQAMKAAHEKADNIVLVDFPRVYGPINKEVKDYLATGVVGEVTQVSFNIYNPDGYPPTVEIPDSIDYETFCGPAPKEPYRTWPDRKSPWWRAQHAFGRGILADWGIHYYQNIRKVLDLDSPTSYSAFAKRPQSGAGEHPSELDVQFSFANLNVNWNHKTWGYISPIKHHAIGVYYMTPKATIFAGDMGWEVFMPDGDVKTFHDPTIPQGGPKYMAEAKMVIENMFTEFSEAVRQQNQDLITATFDDGFKATCATIYADIAHRTDTTIKVDYDTMNILDNEKAAPLVYRKYREGYKHPGDVV